MLAMLRDNLTSPIKQRFPCRASLLLGSAARLPGEVRDQALLRCADFVTARTATAPCISARSGLGICHLCATVLA